MNTLPTSILLPPLTDTERQQFNELSQAFAAARNAVEEHNTDALKARSLEIKTDMEEDPGDLTTLSAELNRLPEQFATARHHAKRALKKVGTRYGVLLPLIDKVAAHADELIARDAEARRDYFEQFGVEPIGPSPIADAIKAFKAQLDRARALIAILAKGTIQPPAPDSILPYSNN